MPDLTVLTWPRHTARLVLRPVTMDDVDAAATYRGDPMVTRYLRHGCLTREQVLQRHRDRVRRMAPGAPDPLLGLAIEHEGRMIGDCMLELRRDGGQWYGRIGYALMRGAHGRGFATEVARELVAIGRDLQLRRLVATTRPANTASQRVLVKAAFSLVPGEGDPDSLLFGLDVGPKNQPEQPWSRGPSGCVVPGGLPWLWTITGSCWWADDWIQTGEGSMTLGVLR